MEMALRKASRCSLCDDGSLISSNNATSSGSSSLMASLTGCLEVASAALCFIPGMCVT